MTIYGKIIGTGSYLPPKTVSNDDLAAFLAKKGVETSDEWIRTRSGILSRHYVEDGVNSSDLGAKAGLKAVEMAKIDANDIELIICATSTPDYYGGFPSTACQVQHKMGITSNCAAFDVQAVCSGFLYAITVANNFIKAGTYKRVMVVGCETYSKILDYNDRTTCVLFGDGAGAVILEASQEPGVLACALHADGKYGDILQNKGKLAMNCFANDPVVYMDGKAVFKLAVTWLDKVSIEVLSQVNLTTNDVDWMVPHQANWRIMQSSARKLNIPEEKVIVTVDRHGNTSAASIPMALDTGIRDGRIKPGHNVLMSAIGGGLTWSAVLLKI